MVVVTVVDAIDHDLAHIRENPTDNTPFDFDPFVVPVPHVTSDKGLVVAGTIPRYLPSAKQFLDGVSDRYQAVTSIEGVVADIVYRLPVELDYGSARRS